MITVKQNIERSLGKQGGIGNEREEVRFWLEMVVNGRTVQSRGTVVTIEQPTLEDVRRTARRMAEYAQDRLGSMEPKEANNALIAIIAEAK